LSVVKACAAVDLSRSAWYRVPQDKLERDKEVIDALQELVMRKPRWGFYLCYKRLRLDGHKWNHKRVYRIYRELGLNIRKRLRRDCQAGILFQWKYRIVPTLYGLWIS